jgi:hypothetical protein
MTIMVELQQLKEQLPTVKTVCGGRHDRAGRGQERR